MLKSEIYQILSNGENSKIEFKRDVERSEQLAKEIVALANLEGGMVLLGVEDDGTIFGIQKENLEEWVMDTVISRKIHPMILPSYEEVSMDDGKKIAIIRVSQGISKPYTLRHNDREEIYIRVGSTSRLATREQQDRLFATGGLIHVESLPVSGTSIESLDLERLKDYIQNVLEDSDVPDTNQEWTKRLCGMGFMTNSEMNHNVCTIAGLLLFGYKPRKYLRQAGVRVIVYNGIEKDYQVKLDNVLDGPLVGLWKMNQGQRELVYGGLIESFIDAMHSFLTYQTSLESSKFYREERWLYPKDAIRELLLNSLAHRDWTRTVDIEISQYLDRLEILSPGGLHNSMTIEKMIYGQRSPRNPLIMEVLKDYKYVDSRGMGIRNKVIPLMRKMNQVDPIFENTEDYLKTVLYIKKDNSHE